MGSSKQLLTNMFAAGGITINGNNPWDMQVHNEKLYDRILSAGSIGFGEAYMDGWWDCENLDDLFFRIQYHRVDKMIPRDFSTLFYYLKARFTNRQTKELAREVGYKHYDIGNEMYGLMLDKWMMYSSGYWDSATDLDEASEAKLDLLCRKLKLEKGMRLLDIGCGFGGMANYAATKYGVSVVGVTISEQQAILAREKNQGLPVEIRVQDYRDLNEQFDRIISIEMLEHVGYRNYTEYMQVAARNLTDDGIFVIQTMGGNFSTKITDPWIDKYIFRNGMLPSVSQLAIAWKDVFILEDLHNFGPDYDPILMAWRKNFEDNWDKIKHDYDEHFYRMMRYYLSCSAASFRSRKNHVWHIVLTKKKHLGAYRSVR